MCVRDNAMPFFLVGGEGSCVLSFSLLGFQGFDLCLSFLILFVLLLWLPRSSDKGGLVLSQKGLEDTTPRHRSWLCSRMSTNKRHVRQLLLKSCMCYLKLRLPEFSVYVDLWVVLIWTDFSCRFRPLLSAPFLIHANNLLEKLQTPS